MTETLDACIKAFETEGYEVCENGDWEDGLEKVAIYTNDGSSSGRLKHAARQLDEKKWTSKLGGWYDVEHAKDALDGPEYGRIAAYMARKKAN